MNDEDESIMGALEAAFEEAEAEAAPAPAPGEAESVLPDTQADAAAAEQTPAADAPTEEGVHTDGTVPGSPAEPESTAVVADRPPEPEETPKGLSAEAREVWKDTPDAIKQHIKGYEQRMEGVAQKFGRDAERARQMDQALQPYQQLFAVNGGVGQTLPGLLQTASILQMGTPAQKAQMMAQLVNQFSVDINALDQALVGNAPDPNQPQAQQGLTAEQVQQMIQQGFQQNQANTMRQDVTHNLQQFAADPANEFYNDVVNEMALILDGAAQSGQNITLKQAYDKACLLNDGVRNVIETRRAARQVQERQAATSSVTGNPTGAEVPPEPESIGDYLSQAWDQVARG